MRNSVRRDSGRKVRILYACEMKGCKVFHRGWAIIDESSFRGIEGSKAKQNFMDELTQISAGFIVLAGVRWIRLRNAWVPEFGNELRAAEPGLLLVGEGGTIE